ncbi:MAG: hydroxymyristoyl-ACP dehydratase [Prevotella sp.]|nr:hydroxymyristoyl-ACP dehydratase [Prevotella sp.]
MELRNELYTLNKKAQEGESWQCEITLNPASFIYQAHFPSEPITPGACLLQIARELLEDILHESLEIVYIKDVKFRSVIRPEEMPSIIYCFSTIDKTKEGTVSSRITVQHENHLLCNIAFTCKKR